MKKLLTALVATASMAFAGGASAIVVGGIDFGSGPAHLDTTTLAETLVTADGDILSGYGQVNTINGNTLYCAGPITCRLFFTFTGYTAQHFGLSTGEFSGGTIKVFYDPIGLTRNLTAFTSAANYAYINSLATEWVELDGHGNLGGGADPTSTLKSTGTLVGPAVSFTGTGLLDVDTASSFGLADVKAFLDGNSQPDAAAGFADILIGTEGSNDFARLAVTADLATCYAITASGPVFIGKKGDFCIQGTASLSGNGVIPEPGSLALAGLALGALGLLRRRPGKTT